VRTPARPPADWSLQPGQHAAWPATEGDELFCAAGAVRVQLVGGTDALPARVLHAGQALRASAAGVFRLEGVAAARGRTVFAETGGAPTSVQKRRSPRLWGRGLAWMFSR
jgi:hypothetical protein